MLSMSGNMMMVGVGPALLGLGRRSVVVIIIVDTSVPREFVRTGETFLASGMGTEKRFFACVGSDVAGLRVRWLGSLIRIDGNRRMEKRAQRQESNNAVNGRNNRRGSMAYLML